MASQEHTALVVVDMQPDFMPGGALPVAEGNTIIPGVCDLMVSDRFGLVVATQDWHPAGHVSFASAHEGHNPFETIELHGHTQVLWPDHCVQGTTGAALHRDLPWDRASVIIRKGTDPAVDSYSGIRNNWDARGARPSTGLAGLLRDRAITHVVVCGLARDYCVKWTAVDAASEGFAVTFVWDFTRAVDSSSDEQVRRDLEAAGVTLAELSHS